MKKIIFVLLLIGLPLNAQTKSFGLKGGLNIASLRASINDMSDASDSKVGVHVGFYGEFPIANKFSIQPELLYSMNGGNVNEDGQKGGFALNYLAVPIMFKYYPVSKFSVELGPQFSFLTDSSITFDGLSADAKELFANIDLGIGVGANYHVSDKINLNLRYQMGIFNVASSEYQATVREETGANSFSIRNNALQFGVGYKF